MSRANPFNKDKTVIEDELKRRRDQRDRYYNEGHYFTWILSNIQYYAFQYPAVAFYRNQEAKVNQYPIVKSKYDNAHVYSHLKVLVKFFCSLGT